MTDALLNLATLAERDDPGFEAELNQIGERYSSTAKAVLDVDQLVPVLDAWGPAIQRIFATSSRPSRS